MKLRRRTEKRKQLRDKRKEAAALRKTHALCDHGDDERIYFSHEEADADRTPPTICVDCGLPRLRVKVIRGGEPRPLPEGGELAIRGIFRRKE